MEQDQKSVPYIVYESAEARHERIEKRLIIALVICIVMMFSTNAIWIYYTNQYEYHDEYVSVDGRDGTANYIGNDGDIVNGKDSR